jgi:hypothetical protein
VIHAPALSYTKIVAVFVRMGFTVISQRVSGISMRRPLPDGTIQYLAIPALNPVASLTLSDLLKNNGIRLQEFLDALSKI